MSLATFSRLSERSPKSRFETNVSASGAKPEVASNGDSRDDSAHREKTTKRSLTGGWEYFLNPLEYE